MELRDDPSSLAPERVIVFEIAGSVGDFVKAVYRVPGLEFMAEYETEATPDELFAVEDSRKGRQGEVRADKAVLGRFYLAMPDLALADEVMFLRPQSVLVNELEPEETDEPGLEARVGVPAINEPIAALLDGVPLQGHALLNLRLNIDDPDSLEDLAIVSRRIHGTAMASLILHGDLNAGEQALGRPLYVRPIMFSPAEGRERTDRDRLLIDTIYRAVVRMKGSEGEEAAAPTVFLVNLSIGDMRRPFARLVSPLARLLDFLSERYGILFLMSGGNVPFPLQLDQYANWTDFERASPEERERAMLEALNEAKHARTILSPAEALNVITIGAQHHDHLDVRPPVANTIDPFDDQDLPNASSALGLGYRRTIKPGIYLPGGREHLRMGRSGGGVEVRFGPPQRLFGLSAAAPDSSGQGQLSKTGSCREGGGNSSAA